MISGRSIRSAVPHEKNAVRLASICILSTGVLLMISTAVCLNFGINEIVEFR